MSSVWSQTPNNFRPIEQPCVLEGQDSGRPPGDPPVAPDCAVCDMKKAAWSHHQPIILSTAFVRHADARKPTISIQRTPLGTS